MIFLYHPLGTTQTMQPPPFVHHLNYASWQTNGYCHTAYLHLGATKLDYPHLVKYLGQNLTILNDHHEPFWYGYISRISLPHNNWEITLDLANTYNAVKIHYTDTEDESNPAVQTTYLLQQDSIDRFGRKELIQTIGDSNAAIAAARQQRIISLAAPAQADHNRQHVMATTPQFHLLGHWHRLYWTHKPLAGQFNTEQPPEQVPVETSAIMAQLLDGNPFLTYEPIPPTNIFQFGFRDGLKPIKPELEKLMKDGGSDNRSYTATVTPHLSIILQPESDQPSEPHEYHIMTSNGTILQPNRQPLHRPMPGIWLRHEEPIIPSAPGILIDTEHFYVNRVNYRPNTPLEYLPRGRRQQPFSSEINQYDG